jgi:ABC-type transporter Mla maintaining outer membrane lipid asymmetry ATPase subunit MlaF
MAGEASVILKNVEKQYGGLRPLRIRNLHVPSGRITMLTGFDRPAAEVFVNLITGAALPDKGEVISMGRTTHAIADSAEWLAFVERFGVMSDRIVMLEAMSVVQNLALSFDLDLESIPADVRARVDALVSEVDIDPSLVETRLADAAPLLRARVNLARALALDPAILVLEHPAVHLSADEANDFASTIRDIAKRRGLTTIGLSADEKFAKATGGRLLLWHPATGEFRQRSALRFWRDLPPWFDGRGRN